MTSQPAKNKNVTVVLYTLWRLLWSITVHTHARTEKCNLFVSDNKNPNGLLEDFRGMKKEKQVCWCYLTWFWCHLCVFFNRSRSTTNENAHWSHVMWCKTSLCRGNLYYAVKEHGNQEMRHATRLVVLLMSLCNYALRNIQFLTTPNSIIVP